MRKTRRGFLAGVAVLGAGLACGALLGAQQERERGMPKPPKPAVAADPDRDQLYVVDLGAKKLQATIPLSDGDEPGRLVEDAGRRVHVALRRGGSVVTVDLATNAIVSRRPVCAAPRCRFPRAGDRKYPRRAKTRCVPCRSR